MELFGPELDKLGAIWRDCVREVMHENWVRNFRQVKESVFGQINDRIRDAAAIPPDRNLDPERMRAMCLAALEEILE